MIFSTLDTEQNEAIEKGIKEFRGQLPTLEAALGAVVIGQKFGWRVLKIVHSPATYRKYEQVLGVKFQNFCPERGEYHKRSWGLSIADKLNSFWAVATGKKKIQGKSTIDDEENIVKEIEKELKNVLQP